jgi:hypothetical protein
MEWYNGISFFGIFILLGVGWMLSANRKVMNWRLIGWGIGIQLFLGLLVFVVLAQIPQRFNLFLILNTGVNKILESAMAGATFVFGDLANSEKFGFIFGFQALPTIIFFSSIIAILYFYGIMPWIIKQFARLYYRVCCRSVFYKRDTALGGNSLRAPFKMKRPLRPAVKPISFDTPPRLSPSKVSSECLTTVLLARFYMNTSF